MATPRDIRRLAFQALFQLDARPVEDAEAVHAGLEDEEGFTAAERSKAFSLARGAFERRAEADAELESLAPGWPASRQPAVDRAILRLAWHEITSGRTPPKVAVNEAVELAKAFGTERSPAFVNGVLDKVLRRVLAGAGAAAGPASAPEAGDIDP